MHKHENIENTKYLGVALGITISFFILEIIGGLLTNSLALLTDAWHMLNDTFALAIALVAAWLARRPVSTKRTYGYYRAEILAAFLQGIFLWVVVAFIMYEAFQRLQQPTEVESLGMLTVAFLGLIANGLSASVLAKSRRSSLNVKGAFLHVVADTLGSVGAITAGAIMLLTGWFLVDPLISILIGVLIFYSSAKLVSDSVNVLLEGVPSHINLERIESRLMSLDGVEGVHDLHVWCIIPTQCLMSGHIVVGAETDRKALTATLITLLKEEFGIEHTTIQLEDEGYPKAAEEH